MTKVSAGTEDLNSGNLNKLHSPQIPKAVEINTTSSWMSKQTVQEEGSILHKEQ